MTSANWIVLAENGSQATCVSRHNIHTAIQNLRKNRGFQLILHFDSEENSQIKSGDMSYLQDKTPAFQLSGLKTQGPFSARKSSESGLSR